MTSLIAPPEYQRLAARIVDVLYLQDNKAVMTPRLVEEISVDMLPIIAYADSASRTDTRYGSVLMSNEVVEFARRWYKTLFDAHQRQTDDSHYASHVNWIGREFTALLIRTAKNVTKGKSA